MPIAALHFFFSHAALAVSDTNERGALLKRRQQPWKHGQ